MGEQTTGEKLTNDANPERRDMRQASLSMFDRPGSGKMPVTEPTERRENDATNHRFVGGD